MDLRLNGKVFIVTGGARGIGAAISTILAQEGASVVIAGRDERDNLAMVESIRTTGGKAAAITAELSDAGACKQVTDFAIEKYGKIDGIVNNAGVNDSAGLEHGSPEKFAASLERNLHHYYAMVHFALPHLKATKGVVVNIGSKVAETGQGNTSGYAAAKGAINALTREWAAELLPYSIRVNTVIPAEVWTPLYENWINGLPDPAGKLAQIVSKIPLEKRFTKPEEIAAMVVFLLSDVSAHTTGQIVHVDGGYTHLDRALS